jgi:hypothetical protein
MLGYIAAGRGAFPVARAYLAEASSLASVVGDSQRVAWIRGTQSLTEYYAGNYEHAVRLAEDGLKMAGDGPQSARIAANSLARAAGKLGDEPQVRRATDLAFGLVDRNSGGTGFPSSVTLGSYSRAQVAANAATAFLSVGNADQVEAHLRPVLPEVEIDGSPWTRSLVLIDLASAAAAYGEADLERARSLLSDALSGSAARPVIAVTLRAREAVTAARRRWGSTREVRELRDLVRATEAGRD